MRVCHDKQLLRRLYTQNIDGLDHLCLPEGGQKGTKGTRGAKGAKGVKVVIVAVHGTMATASCQFCGAPVPMPWFQQQVRRNIKDIYKTDKEAPRASSTIGMRTRVHTHTYEYSYVHTLIHTHTYTHTHIHTHMYAHTCIHIHSCTHAHMCTGVHIHTQHTNQIVQNAGGQGSNQTRCGCMHCPCVGCTAVCYALHITEALCV
jgi:hypothetical protein